jgi:hypothetical protein
MSFFTASTPGQASIGCTQPFSTHWDSVESRMYITSNGAPLRSMTEALALYSADGAPSSSTVMSGFRFMNSSMKPWTVCGWNVQNSIFRDVFWARAVPRPGAEEGGRGDRQRGQPDECGTACHRGPPDRTVVWIVTDVGWS